MAGTLRSGHSTEQPPSPPNCRDFGVRQTAAVPGERVSTNCATRLPTLVISTLRDRSTELEPEPGLTYEANGAEHHRLSGPRHGTGRPRRHHRSQPRPGQRLTEALQAGRGRTPRPTSPRPARPARPRQAGRLARGRLLQPVPKLGRCRALRHKHRSPGRRSLRHSALPPPGCPQDHGRRVGTLRTPQCAVAPRARSPTVLTR